MSNRLAHETSPYLLQHKDNPVDWYPWGEDALAKARSEQKPILLSIGYAACHWCHVMEHESFEDDETAAIMNERFVPIKVDREERPDLDAVYMEAVQAMTGQGGWPMTVFLTPEGVPFYGGTYFPKEDRHGLPSFKRLLVSVAETWEARRSEVESQGKRLTEHLELQTRLEPSDEATTGELLDRAVAGLQTAFDPEYGGFGSAPKFPQAMTIDFLLRMTLKGSEPAAAMANRTLDAMAAGGMFDQIAGGFARYSVDRYWLVPHFEKMLYDNAQLLRTYARSHAETKSERHLEVAEMTVAWLVGEMRDGRGGFYSSLDADSEGEEGKFYVFSLDEVGAATGDDFDAAVRMYGLSEGGNFEGKSIPVFAARLEDRERAERVRKALLGIRSERVRPGTDDKVLAAWNGLAAAALAEAGVLLSRADWVQAAEEAMRFVLGEMIVDGRLMRSYRDGVVKHLAYCEDYAFVLEACLDLYQATFDPDWLTHARRMADEAIRLFGDDDGGGFFTTGSDAERLVRRPKDVIDNALPSANSVMALELQRLARLTGDRDYETRALSCVRLVGDAAGRSPTAFGHLLSAIDFYVSDAREVAIVGGPGSDELLAVVRDGFRPNDVVAFTQEPTESVPLLRGREPLDGRAAAYVCRYGTCDLPTDDAGALRRQLEPQ